MRTAAAEAGCAHTLLGGRSKVSQWGTAHTLLPAGASLSDCLCLSAFSFFPLQALANNSKKAPTKPEQLPESCTENHHHSARCPRMHADTVLAPSSNAAKYMLHVKPK